MNILEQNNFEAACDIVIWNPSMREIAFEWGLSIKETSSRKKYRKRFRQAKKDFDKMMAEACNNPMGVC